MILRVIIALAFLLVAPACKSGSGGNSPAVSDLTTEVNRSLEEFFEGLGASEVRLRSHFALFIPENSVDTRYIDRFRRTLEAGIRSAASPRNLYLSTASETVFFIPDLESSGGSIKAFAPEEAQRLAQGFRNGAPTSWKLFHAVWEDLNRIAIGDKDWIDKLPTSIRSELSSSLEYVLRVDLSATPIDRTSFRHDLTLQWLEVGSERSIYTKRSSFMLTYSLT